MINLENEIWKDVIGYEKLYLISSLGKLKSLQNNKEKILKLIPDKKGYLRTRIGNLNNKKTIKIHRLVAIAFIPNPENKKEVNHRDGNKQNNNIENLEWCTGSENIKHAFKTGLRRSDGNNHNNRKLSSIQVKEIREKRKIYSCIELGKMYNVSRVQILNIVTYKMWKNI
jgi:hypothetical protein